MVNVLGNTRSLRTDLKSSGNVSIMTDVMECVEQEWIGQGGHLDAYVQSRVRHSLPRFDQLFHEICLLPPQVFFAMLEQQSTVRVNGAMYSWTQQGALLQLRDRCVRLYKPVLAQARKKFCGEISHINAGLIKDFVDSWFDWEDCWLTEMENHSLAAIQPLCKAILSLEPLVKSKKKAAMMAYPARASENRKTVKCVQGLLEAIGGLSAATLSSVARENNPDADLIVLMDYLLREYDDDLAQQYTMFYGLSDDSDATFYDAHKNEDIALAGAHGYAFRISCDENTIQKNAARADRLFEALEDLKIYLEQSAHDLDICSPDLEQNQHLKSKLEQYEAAYKNAKKCLEPENLI